MQRRLAGQRVKSPYPATQDPAYEHTLRLHLQDFISTPSEPVKKILDATALRRLIDKPLGATSIGRERGDIDHALAIGNWLKECDVELLV